MGESVRFVDIGSNLTDSMFLGFYNGKKQHSSDLHRVIERARHGGVDRIIITSGSYEECVRALEICEEHDPKCEFLFTTIGVHPTRTREFLCDSCRTGEAEFDCENCDLHSLEYLSRLKNLLRESKKRIVAIGEFGLDSERTHFSSMSIQERYFELQFELLKECQLPMFLHLRSNTLQEHSCKDDKNSCESECRGFQSAVEEDMCFTRFIEILNKYRSLWEHRKGVVHSFTGNQEQLRIILDIGLDIGVNGCSLKSQANLDTVSKIPIDRLHLETDSPWCDIKKSHCSYSFVEKHFPQVSKPSKWSEKMLVKGRNEPVKIVQVAQVLHKVLASGSDLSFNDFASRIYDNTLNIYFSESR